jgi:hypothetical protein
MAPSLRRIGCGGSTEGTASATRQGSQQTQPSGVTEPELQAAMEATRPSGGGQPPQQHGATS